MEAITKYGLHSQALVHCQLKKSYSIIPVRYLTLSRNPLPKNLVITRAKPSESDHEATNRPLIQFPPSLLDGYRSVSVNHSEIDGLGRIIETMKPRVREKLVCSDTKERILLIQTLVNLGVAYHFETEIEEFLKDAYEKVEDITIGEEDIYTVSTIFRVFRLYRYNVSSDIFNKFKGEDGNFKNYLIDDVRGMISFYQASHFGTNSEEILEEAMVFTQKHLELYVTSTNNHHQPHVNEYIQNVLYFSQQENTEVLTARENIQFYEQETTYDKDDMLLKFAKHNFKFMQLHYIQELQTLVKWWEELDLKSKTPNYFRERVVECLFWATVYMEPRYSSCRLILSKCVVLYTVLDDACDAYCTLPEVIDFVESLERWEADVIDTLPEHLKVVLRSFFELFEELKREMIPEGRLYIVQLAIDEVKRLFKANMQIAKWARRGYVPNFDEYMEVGLVTGGAFCALATAFIGMSEIAGKEAYEWIISRPKLIQTLDLKSRLRDDVATYKDEMARGEIANGINCYMKQYGVMEEEAFLELDKKIKHTSKLLNEEFLKTSGVVPLKLAHAALNIGRTVDVNYKYGDGLTYAEMKKDQISSLFFDIITL